MRINKNEIRLQMLSLIKNNDFDALKIQEIKELVLELNDANLKVSLGYLFDRWSDYILREIDRNEVDQQFEFALTKNEEAVLLNPKCDKYYYNWGVTIGHYAKYKRSEEREQLIQLELEKYEIAANLNSYFDSVFYNWGKGLFTIALTKNVNQAIVYLQKASEKMERAVSINLGHTNAWDSLGTVYSYLAHYDADNSNRWYEEAIFCYSTVTEIKPTDSPSYDNWGIALKSLALMKEGPEQEKLFALAIEKHLIAEENGGGVYNLACTYAVMGAEQNAFIQLRKAIETNDIEIDEILEDSDWENYLENKLFKEIIVANS